MLILGATALDMTVLSFLYPKYSSLYDTENVPSQTLVWGGKEEEEGEKPQFMLKRTDIGILTVITLLQNSLRIPSEQ